MAFSRALAPPPVPDPSELTSAMVGIGMAFAAMAKGEPNIEDTLLSASRVAMEQDDLRVLAILVTWFGVHHRWVNADRLIQIVRTHAPDRARTLWAALGAWQATDHRFSRLVALHEGPRVDLLRAGSAFQIRRHGEDPRFEETPLRVPASVLRDRAADVLTPADLARRHRTYRWRVTIGPTYRADAWAALEGDPGLTATALARKAYASFATAWHVKREFAIACAFTQRSEPAVTP